MSFDLATIDVDKLKKDVASALVSAISELVDGAEADIQNFATDISKDLLEAQLTGEKAITIQLLNQLKLLAEINSIRVRQQRWFVVEAVTKAVFEAALAGILSVLL